MDTADFEAAGVYDPDAPNAAERLELLRWMADEHGVPFEDIRACAGDGERLITVVGDREIRPGGRFTRSDVGERTGLEEEQITEMLRALGYPDFDEDLPMFGEQDIGAFAAFGLAQKVFPDESVVAFTRTMGSSLAKIAEAAQSMYIADVEGDLVAHGATELERAKANLEAVRLLDAMRPTIDAVFRSHMLLAVERGRRTHADRKLPGTSLARLAVGFVDITGYTSLSRGLDAKELSDLVTLFEGRANDIAISHDGRVVKHVGDAVMFTTVEPPAAVAIAADLLRAFEGDDHVRPHGGLAFGEVLARGGDYYGPVVNTAARLSEIAVPGEVLVTADIAAEVDGLDPAGRRLIKGYDEPLELFALTLG